MNLKKSIIKKIITGFLVGTSLMATVSIPAFASYTMYPSKSMSTSNSKYYSDPTPLTYYNAFDGVCATYKFIPVWRINTGNSISATSNASTFKKGNLLSQWKLAASEAVWYGNEKVGNRVNEAYYAEGIAIGWGINLSGSVGIKGGANGFDANISASSSVTVGQSYTEKFQEVVWTGWDWTYCYADYMLY